MYLIPQTTMNDKTTLHFIVMLRFNLCFQALSKDQYMHLLSVTERVYDSNVTIHWPYDDFKDIAESVLPSEAEICQHHDGKFYLLARRYYSSLHSYVHARNKLTEKEALDFFGQIVRIVAFCHTVGIVVRDLNLHNFVFTDEKQ